MQRNTNRALNWLLPISLLAAACGAQPAAQPLIVPSETPAPTSVVVVPTSAAECGAEAAIGLAQTQSDLALAALAELEATRPTTQDEPAIARKGLAAFTSAREVMKAYNVPECLAPGKKFALQFFDERIAAYAALQIGDAGSYETRLTNGEIARQNMITAVNGVLGP